jgi:hypothetical protein
MLGLRARLVRLPVALLASPVFPTSLAGSVRKLFPVQEIVESTPQLPKSVAELADFHA